jgi:hypothetical protein
MLLDTQLRENPPWSFEGFEVQSGDPRELYIVPDELIGGGRRRPNSAFGVYAFWVYCHYADRAAMAAKYWDAIRARVAPLLTSAPYPFDVRATSYRQDESQRLNGDLAGLIGFVRLARLVADEVSAQSASDRVQELLELRANLDRVNTQVVEATASASNRLHNFKLGRYCDLTPEVGFLLTVTTEGLSARRLAEFRSTRNGWYLARGDRMIGGENYTNPLNFSRSLFSGAALVEQRPATELRRFMDVPWCAGDLYFLEKCVLVLWAGGGRQLE